MIEVQGLTKYYGPKPAITDITFSVAEGEIVGLLGPNGAGKTTTMRIITGFLPASSGTARVAGYDVATKSLDVRRHIGYLPETIPLYTDLTVSEYLDFMARIRGVGGRKRRDRIDETIELCRLEEVADARIGKLSKGYRQRVGLAQALIHQPKVLILDEPTIGLDPKQIIETRELIKSLRGERTIILSSHILPEVSATCNRVVIIDRGKVIAEDSPDNLTKRIHGSERIQILVRGDGAAVAEKLKTIPQVIAVERAGEIDGRCTLIVECELGSDRREDIVATIIGNGWSLLEMRPLGMTLEEIFLRLTTDESEVGEGEGEEEEEKEDEDKGDG